jgi:hypothetical protein
VGHGEPCRTKHADPCRQQDLLTAVQIVARTETHREPDGRRLYRILVALTCVGPNDQLSALILPRTVSIPTAVFPQRASLASKFFSAVSLVFSRFNLVISAKRLCASLEFLIVALLLLLTTLLATNLAMGHNSLYLEGQNRQVISAEAFGLFPVISVLVRRPTVTL